MKTNSLRSLLSWAFLILFALATPALADEPPKIGPANPEDSRIAIEWEQRIHTEGGDPVNVDGIQEPMTSAIFDRDIRIPHTRQIDNNGENANLLSIKRILIGDPRQPAHSSTGHLIEAEGILDPHRALGFAVSKMADAAGRDDVATMREGAHEALDVLLGRTEGKIFDGFPLLNFNRWKSSDVLPEHFSADSVPGEYKMKTLRPVLDPETGEQLTEAHWMDPEQTVRVWQIDVNHLWYGQQFDSDTFLLAVPYEVEVNGQMVQVDWDDTIRVNWTIYSLVEEDFSPTQVMRDALVDNDTPGPSRGGTVRFPFKGEDTVWVRVNPGTVTEMTLQHTALRFIRGFYIWGWNVHPPRIQFIQPIFEYLDPDTGEPAWDWHAESFSYRNREDLTLDAIALEAPEMKLYTVAKAAYDGTATPSEVVAMLTDPAVTPTVGDWHDWIGLMSDQRQLPPEVKAQLAAAGKTEDNYDFVTVYMNNEMYGAGPLLHTIRLWSQGEVMKVGLFNLDRHTHYFRNVGFGAPLHNDLGSNLDDGIFSFEIMNFKPLYGAPKVAEMQYRAGWGFRPHYGVVQQEGVFPRASDKRRLRPYLAPLVGLPLDSEGNELGPNNRREIYWGYQYTNADTEPFPFNPPPFIIDTVADPSFDLLYDLSAAPHQDLEDGLSYRDLFLLRAQNDPDQFAGKTDQFGKPLIDSGLVIGQRTEGWGLAQMCPGAEPGFCPQDISGTHPLHLKNWPAPNDPSVPKTELRFPPFLRNPCQEGNGNCGDIIPPTTAWEPFLFLNPDNGTIFMEPGNPDAGYWTDHTFAHGATIYAGQFQELAIEMPRSGAQLFYQFDDLFHDNAIFSPHPILDTSLGLSGVEGEVAEAGETVEGASAGAGGSQK